MSKPITSDCLVIGGGVAAAVTALAVAKAPAHRKGAAPRSVCLVQTGPEACSDLAAASYSFLNPAAGELLPAVRPRMRQLTDGPFRGLVIVGGRDGRRAEFRSRGICGYYLDGPKLLAGLLTLCRAAGVKIVRAGAGPRFDAGDHGVNAAWADGGCHGGVALLADAEVALAGQADGLGFRHSSLVTRLARCYGVTIPASPGRLDAVFGRNRPMITVWQLRSLAAAGEATAADGFDGHAWIMPRRNCVAVGMTSGAAESVADGPNHAQRTVGRVLDELQSLNVLPADLTGGAGRAGPVASWRLPVATALEIESHAAKRSLAVGLAGGFVAALSGQWLYPSIQAATLAAAVAGKALADPRPQDVLAQFGACWRGALADYLRSPNTRLSFLLPLVLGNRQIADRFSRAYLFGENF